MALEVENLSRFTCPLGAPSPSGPLLITNPQFLIESVCYFLTLPSARVIGYHGPFSKRLPLLVFPPENPTISGTSFYHPSGRSLLGFLAVFVNYWWEIRTGTTSQREVICMDDKEGDCIWPWSHLLSARLGPPLSSWGNRSPGGVQDGLNGGNNRGEEAIHVPLQPAYSAICFLYYDLQMNTLIHGLH